MGLAGGLFYDAILCATTGRKTGYIAVCKQIEEGNMTPGSILNAMLMPLGDALMGKTGGDIASMINFDLHGGAASVEAGHGGGDDGGAKTGGGAHAHAQPHAGHAAHAGHHGGDAGSSPAGHSPHSPLQPSQDFVSHGYHESSIGYGDALHPHIVYVDGQAYTVLYAGDGSLLSEMYTGAAYFDPSALQTAHAGIGYGDGAGMSDGFHAGGGGGGAASHAAHANAGPGSHASQGVAGAKGHPVAEGHHGSSEGVHTFGEVMEYNLKFAKPHSEVK